MFDSNIGNEVYGYSYQLRPELQGGCTSDDGGMFDSPTPQEAHRTGEEMARTGKYARLSVYHWNTGEVIFELERL